MPCLICQHRGKRTSSNVSGHHLKSYKSGGECVDENLIALCHEHHVEIHARGLTQFTKVYGSVMEKELKSKGWEFSEFMNKWMRLTKEGWDD